MEDAGARKTSIFTDFGVVTTTEQNGPPVTRMMMTQLAAGKPDAIVFELGDGLLGAYGVEAILKDAGIKASISCLVLCANDPVAAWGGVKLLRDEFELQPDVVTGPATDNLVGTNLIRDRLGIPAFNAITHGTDLGDTVAAVIELNNPVNGNDS